MTERQRELHQRLSMPEALLSRTGVAELGLPRRGVDAVFRALPVLVLPRTISTRLGLAMLTRCAFPWSVNCSNVCVCSALPRGAGAARRRCGGERLHGSCYAGLRFLQ